MYFFHPSCVTHLLCFIFPPTLGATLDPSGDQKPSTCGVSLATLSSNAVAVSIDTGCIGMVLKSWRVFSALCLDVWAENNYDYRQVSNIRRTQSKKHKCFSSRLAVVFAQSIEARCEVDNEDVVGAAPTGDAPTTSEWSTILLPTKVRLILETLRYEWIMWHYSICEMTITTYSLWFFFSNEPSSIISLDI